MPKPTSTGLIETLTRRIAQVRRERNARELQRAGYLLAAAAAGTATLLLVTALFASTRVFAVVAWSTTAALLVTALLLAREARARWLGRAQALAWIERRSRLGGRLRSLIEIDARGAGAGEAFFLPLLAAENARALALWDPRRLVARRVPRGPLALAVASVGVLLAALTLTPVLYPRIPDLAALPAAGEPADALAAWRGDALAVPGASPAGDGEAAGERPPALARLPAEIQERIRQSVWGRAWERVREALARAARVERDAGPGAPSDQREPDGAPEDPWQLAERGADERLARDHRGRAPDDALPPAARRRPRAPAGTLAPTEEDTAAVEPAPGAGNGSDPDLYGPATAARDRAAARFDLGLLTRMRLGSAAAPGDPGAAPPRDRDRQPALAAATQPDELVHEMPVPRAYEPIVRQVFAHRGGASAR